MQDGQSAEAFDGLSKRCFHALTLAHVGVDEQRIAARIIRPRAGRLSGRFTAIFIDFGDHDFGPFFGKAFGGGAANAATAAGNECNFPCQSRHGPAPFAIVFSCSVFAQAQLHPNG